METNSGKHARLTSALLWIYLALWLTEGLFRKWILPQFSQPLLLIRDPVVIVIYLSALKEGVFPFNRGVQFLITYGVIAFAQAAYHVTLDGVPLPIAAFGLRTLLLHLPLLWIVPNVWTAREVRFVGFAILSLAPFMAALMVIQFESPSTHWLNAATMEGGAQIGSAGERIRPAGIFSFITGPILFFALCSAFVWGGFLERALFPRWMVWISAGAILVATSVSGSRTLLLGCSFVTLSALICFIVRRKGFSFLWIALAVVSAVVISSRLSFAREGYAVLAERWSGAEEVEGVSVFGRYLRTFASGADWAGRVPLLGKGMGMTSNLAHLKFNLTTPVETEWERVVYEVGALTGFPYLIFRAIIAGGLVVMGVRGLARGNCLVLLLSAACCLEFLTGNFRQVTTLGFAVICGGLCLAALRGDPVEPQSVEDAASPIEAPRRPPGRGRLSVGRGVK